MIKLVNPSNRYKDSYLEFLQESQKEGSNMDLDIEDLKANFGGFIKRLNGYRKGIGLPKGYGKKILSLALKKAKQIGIKKVLITCNITNIGSKKIIEANGGVLDSIEDQGKGKPKKLRYWINLF